jgi:hypothetical protein
MARQPAKTFMINTLNSPLLVRYGASLFHKTNRDCRHRQEFRFLAGTKFFVGVSKLRGFDRH